MASLLVCSGALLRAQDAASLLYNQGIDALNKQQFDDAAKDFDQIITGYPTTKNIDEVRIRAGYAYLYASKYAEAVDRLSRETGPDAKPEFRGTGLYLTGLAQFSAGQKGDKTSFSRAVSTFTTLLDFLSRNPTPDHKANVDQTEQALYYRSLANYELSQYDAAAKDLIQLTTAPQFASSLSRPDYFLRLGNVYAVQAGQAMTNKQPAAAQGLVAQALGAFDQVSRDPNARVQANEANLQKAEVLFFVANLEPGGAGYQKALDAFRTVVRKADLIPIQEQRLNQLRAQAAANAQANAARGVNSLGSDISTLIAREQGRLTELQDTKTADPIIQALIRIAECYVQLQQPDEARTVLHRLAHATLTPEQQQEVDFQTLISYTLGGQTDAADKALTDYLGKHAGDPQADTISIQIASTLMTRKDYTGALKQAQRSLQDFPPGKGKHVDDALNLEANALRMLGRVEESNKVVDDFLKSDPTNPLANNMLLSRAQNELTARNLPAAEADFGKVKDNPSAGPELQSIAYASYVSVLQNEKKYDDVLREAKAFQTKFPNTKGAPSVALFAALAQDAKHDPAAVAALQDVARKYPKDDAAPFALNYVVNIYQRAGNVPLMTQAAKDLQTAYPDAYQFIAQADAAVAASLIKEKQFEAAVALYQPLADAPKPEIAADAQDKIGDTWLAAAKAMGYYQSMSLETRPEAEKRLANAEQAYLATLKKFADQPQIGDALAGLVNVAKQRRAWGLLKDPDLEGYIAKLAADLTDPTMQAHVELTKAGLVFVAKDGAKDFPVALDRFRKVTAANPALRLTRQEADQYGQLLLTAKDYPTAMSLFNDQLAQAAPNDVPTQGGALFGLGSVALAQGDKARAKDYFTKLEMLPGSGRWLPNIATADYAIAWADEDSTAPADVAQAKALYGQIMTGNASSELKAKAMLGYGRLLEKAGAAVKPPAPGSTETAVHYYQEPDLIFHTGTPAESAEGLYDAGQAFDKSGDKANAKAQYDSLLKTYGTSAPDWADKAKAAGGQG